MRPQRLTNHFLYISNPVRQNACADALVQLGFGIARVSHPDVGSEAESTALRLRTE